MNEQEYRQKVHAAFERIEQAFMDMDPDLAECEQSMGSLTITSADKSRLILSSQPSVRQVWLALAAQGVAHHFNYDAEKQHWIDDKGKGIELLSFLKAYFKKSAGIDLNL